MAYKDLSLKDRATVIKIAVANGITTLPEIKEAYNKFNEGGHLLQTGGNTKSSSNVEFSLLDPESWKYKGSPIYEENISFAQAFSDAVYNDNDYFKWGNSMYNTDIDWNRKFSNTSNGTKPFQEFAEIMYPAVIRVLKENNYPLSMAPNIVRQAALESSYGTDARGSRGYNLSGIKWTPNSGDYKHSTGADGKEYIDFNDLHDYLNYKVQLLNNKYDALNAENTIDFVNRLHPKQSKTRVYSDSYTGDYSGNYKSYINNLNRLKSLDKYLLPLVKANGGHLFETGGKEFPNLLSELTVEAKYPYSNRVWSTADSSNADFVRRLLNNDKQSIPTWDNAGSYSTHKMASQDNIAFPMVQRNNGTLTDYSHPMWLNPNTGFVTALKNNDYIEFKTLGDARYYAEHYKQHYPEFFRGFKEGGYLHSTGGPLYPFSFSKQGIPEVRY